MSQPLLRADFVRPGLWRGRGRETESEVGPTSCFHLGLFSETSSLHHLEGTLLVCGSGLRVYWVPGFVRAVFPHTLLISTTQLQRGFLVPFCLILPGGSGGQVSASKAGDLGSIPESGRSPGKRNDNPLQYSCLENSMDGGAWWATVHGVTKSRTRLRDFSLHFSLSLCWIRHCGWYS